jgi:phosphoribosylaminoimidazole-succinocarboxamide synthase
MPKHEYYWKCKSKSWKRGFYYPYVFEFAIKAGLIKNDKLAQPLIEPSTTEFIATFSRAAVLQMIGTLGCH